MELAAQVAHVRLDDVGVPAEVVPPYVLQDLPLRQNAAGVEHEIAQQRELGCGERDRRLSAEDFVPPLVEDEIGEAQDVAGQHTCGAPQDRLDPRDDLGEAERLGDVVVAAGAQRLDLVLRRVLRREKEHCCFESLVAQATTDLNALDVGEHPVEHDEVRLETRDGGERVAPVVRLFDLIALVAKGGRDCIDDRLLVVDDKDALLGARVAVQRHAPTVARVSVNTLRITTLFTKVLGNS